MSCPLCQRDGSCIAGCAENKTSVSPAGSVTTKTEPVIDYDFLLAEIDKEGAKAEEMMAAEKLAGNVVKEARAEGEFISYNVMRGWIKRLKYRQ